MATKATSTTRTRRAAAPAQQAATAEQTQASGPVPAVEITSELVHLDPRTLLIEGNIRRDAALTEEFVQSVREHGVLVPIVAVRTEAGVQVRYGQRRTLAAIEAHRPTVPLMLFSADPGGDLDRIVQQWHENENRRGLSVAGPSIIRFRPVLAPV